MAATVAASTTPLGLTPPVSYPLPLSRHCAAVTAAPVAPAASVGYAVKSRFAVQHDAGTAVDTKPMPLATRRWEPSDGVLRTDSAVVPGIRATIVLDPPPSRLRASSAPSDFMWWGSPRWFMPPRERARRSTPPSHIVSPSAEKPTAVRGL